MLSASLLRTVRVETQQTKSKYLFGAVTPDIQLFIKINNDVLCWRLWQFLKVTGKVQRSFFFQALLNEEKHPWKHRNSRSESKIILKIGT